MVFVRSSGCDVIRARREFREFEFRGFMKNLTVGNFLSSYFLNEIELVLVNKLTVHWCVKIIKFHKEIS